MTIEPVLASEDKLDQTKLTHLANSLLRLPVARVRASDNEKQANRCMVVVLQVTNNGSFLAHVVWFLRRTYSKPHKASFFTLAHFCHQTKPCSSRWQEGDAPPHLAEWMQPVLERCGGLSLVLSYLHSVVIRMIAFVQWQWAQGG